MHFFCARSILVKMIRIKSVLKQIRFRFRVDYDVEAGDNGFVMTPKRWIESTGAIGIISKQGRYAATFAHRDIAFEFTSWISPEFKLYIIEDYQRLKKDENSRLSLNWNLNREIAKLNYRIHTDAI